MDDADLTDEDLQESEEIDSKIASEPEVKRRIKKHAIYEANKAKYLERDRARYRANRDKIAAQKHQYYLANRERILARNRACRARKKAQRKEKEPDAAATAIGR